MDGFYLTLNQGVTSGIDTKETGDKRYHNLYSTSEKVRKRISDLSKNGFELSNEIDLNATSPRGQSYGHSTIAYKYYGAHGFTNNLLVHDLSVLIEHYLIYLKSK